MLRKMLEMAETFEFGSGLLAKGFQDQFFFDDMGSPCNYLMMVVGACLFLRTHYVEPDRRPSSCTTLTIQKSLQMLGGYGVVAPVDNLIRGKDRNTANLGNILTTTIIPLALDQLENGPEHPIPLIPHGRFRFCVSLLGDILLATGLRPPINEHTITMYSMMAIPLGAALSFAEFYYGSLHDDEFDLKTALTQRSLRLVGSLNFFFVLLDFINGNPTKFAVADDAFSMMVGVALFATAKKMNQIIETKYTGQDDGDDYMMCEEGTYQAIADLPCTTQKNYNTFR